VLIVGAGPTGMVLALWLTRYVARRRNAVYLVRPDGYIAQTDAKGSATRISGFLDQNHINDL
jgi:hypothetical protein